MIFDSKEIMSVPFLTMEASVGHAEEVFRKHALFSLPVLDADGSFVGILCLKKVFLAAAAAMRRPTLSLSPAPRNGGEVSCTYHPGAALPWGRGSEGAGTPTPPIGASACETVASPPRTGVGGNDSSMT